jgi:hypothetical protein
LNEEGFDMDALIEKTLRIVDSCVTPQQLEIAENFAERARTQIAHEEWLNIASAIQAKSGQVLFFDAEDWSVLRRAAA